MESRRLVVWISAGILGFQGATLVFDLLNCTVLSWLFVQRHGFSLPSSTRSLTVPSAAQVLQPPEPSRLPVIQHDPFAPLPDPAPLPPQPPPPSAASPGASAAPPLDPVPPLAIPVPEPPQGQQPIDPMALFCQRPQGRVDTAVSQGLSILAGLVLGGSLSAAGGGAGGRKGDDGGP
jgi:hypothetical protein